MIIFLGNRRFSRIPVKSHSRPFLSKNKPSPLSVVSSRSNFERIQQKYNIRNEVKYSPKKLDTPNVVVDEDSTWNDIVKQLDNRVQNAGKLPVISEEYVLEIKYLVY